MRIYLFTVLALCTVLLSGCFQVERVVTVRPDGSGKYTETVMLSKKMVDFIQSLAAKEGEQAKPFELVSPEELKSAASKMGNGVNFVSSRTVSNESFSGYSAVYAFKDINQLLLDPDPPSLDKNAPSAKQKLKIQFNYTPGPSALLTVALPTAVTAQEQPNTAQTPQPPKNEQPDPKDVEMLKEMFDGMRFGLRLVIDGNIIETNASYRDGNDIVIAEMDFGKLLNMAPEQLTQLKGLQQNDFAASLEIMKNIPGIKIDRNEKLIVRFK